MNRAERRRAERERRQLAAERRRLPDAGQQVVGTVGACADCSAQADITFIGDGRAVVDIWHVPSCPAARGVTRWRPAA